MRGDIRLRGLAAVHVVLLLAFSAVAPIRIRAPWNLMYLPFVPQFALVFAQVALLALWAVFSPASWMTRPGILVAGVAGLEGLLDWSTEAEFALMPSIAAALCTAALVVARGLGVRLRTEGEASSSPRPEPERLKFSIRGLMLVTLVVALLSAGTRELASHRSELMLSLTWALIFAVVGLLACWAALGVSSPRRWCLALGGFSLLLGAGLTYAVASPPDPTVYIYVLLIMLLHPVILLGSLLVVRSRGVRLARRPLSPSELPAAGVPAAVPE